MLAPFLLYSWYVLTLASIRLTLSFVTHYGLNIRDKYNVIVLVRRRENYNTIWHKYVNGYSTAYKACIHPRLAKSMIKQNQTWDPVLFNLLGNSTHSQNNYSKRLVIVLYPGPQSKMDVEIEVPFWD